MTDSLSVTRRFRAPILLSAVLVLLGGSGTALGAPTFLLPNDDGAWAVPDGIASGTPSGEIRVDVEGVGSHRMAVDELDTLRSDVFREGQPTVFDVLVALSKRGDLELGYHYDETLATYVVDQMNGGASWWFEARYDGGWFEANVTRMDLYPVKGGMTIRFVEVSASHLESIHRTFRDEVTRLEAADGQVILPDVTIHAPRWSVQFEDVAVTAHDVRADVLQPGTITALDILLSLGEQGLLEALRLTWYESVGSADPVGDFFVEQIDADGQSAEAYGSCGFVYEVGPRAFGGFRGSHVHVPSDVRVLVSPEYTFWFWICL